MQMAYNPRAIRAAYDQIAVREDNFEKGFSLRNDVPRKFMLKYLRASDVVLDVGGGTAINAIAMARICQRVTLLDISPEILKRAAVNIRESGLAEKIDLVESDAADLAQFGDETFSFVVCVGGALSYVLEKGEQAIREMARVSQKGAFLVLGCDSRTGFVRWLLQEAQSENQLDAAIEAYETARYEAGEGAFARLYTPAELTGLIEEAGCEVVEIGSTPTLLNSWNQMDYPPEKREKLLALELKFCTAPELLGVGHHLFCIARKV
jgi:ubiquinone/menaquinone biosynthesis C-methylase UbiE